MCQQWWHYCYVLPTLSILLPIKTRCRMGSFPSGILLTSALTGWKELHEFNSSGLTVFSIMGGIGVITVAVFCILLRNSLFGNDKLSKIQGTLCPNDSANSSAAARQSAQSIH